VSTIVYVVVTLHTITQTRDPSPAHALLKERKLFGMFIQFVHNKPKNYATNQRKRTFAWIRFALLEVL
jgi:hypothetical protein